MKCRKCGHESIKDAKFCENCGELLPRIKYVNKPDNDQASASSEAVPSGANAAASPTEPIELAPTPAPKQEEPIVQEADFTPAGSTATMTPPPSATASASSSPVSKSDDSVRIPKKVLIIVIACVIVLLAFIGLASTCSSHTSSNTSNTVQTPQVDKYQMTINAKCEGNWLLATYDVDIYIDGNLIGTLDHGAENVYYVDLEAGKHSIEIRALDYDGKKEKDNLNGSHNFETKAEETVMDFDITIHTTNITFDEFSVMTKSEKEAADKADAEEAANKAAAEKAAADQKAAEEAAAAEAAKDKTAISRTSKNYTIYYLLDFATMTARNYSTSDTGVMVGSFTGTLDSGIVISWPYDGGYTEQLKYKSGSTTSVVLTDYSGATWDYKTADVTAALAVLNKSGYHEIAAS